MVVCYNSAMIWRSALNSTPSYGAKGMILDQDQEMWPIGLHMSPFTLPCILQEACNEYENGVEIMAITYIPHEQNVIPHAWRAYMHKGQNCCMSCSYFPHHCASIGASSITGTCTGMTARHWCRHYYRHFRCHNSWCWCWQFTGIFTGTTRSITYFSTCNVLHCMQCYIYFRRHDHLAIVQTLLHSLQHEGASAVAEAWSNALHPAPSNPNLCDFSIPGAWVQAPARTRACTQAALLRAQSPTVWTSMVMGT